MAFEDSIKAWQAAVDNGLIQGDPTYYSDPRASQEEINHALIVAILEAHGIDWNPAPVDPPVDGVVVSPFDWRSLIADTPAETPILFSEGVYEGFSVQPKPGQQFSVVPGADVTLVGGGLPYAFHSSKTPSVAIDGRAAAGGRIVVRDYQGSFFLGAISNLLDGDWYGDGNNLNWLGDGWKVHGVRMENVGPHGITLCGNRAQLTDFEIIAGSRRMEIGFKMLYGFGQLVADGEVSGATPTNWGNEGGGCKCWVTDGLTIERVKSHDHIGPGLWADQCNWNMTIRDCEIWACYGPGIFQEIAPESQNPNGTGKSRIYNNVVRDMTYDSQGFYRNNAGILVVSSGPIDVTDNTIRNAATGVYFTDENRETVYGPAGNASGFVANNLLDNAGQSGGGGGDVTWQDNTYMNGSVGPG